MATQNYQKLGAKCAKSVSLSSVCDESVSQVAGEAHGGRAGSGISVEIAVFQPLGVVNPSHEKTTNCRFWCFFWVCLQISNFEYPYFSATPCTVLWLVYVDHHP